MSVPSLHTGLEGCMQLFEAIRVEHLLHVIPCHGVVHAMDQQRLPALVLDVQRNSTKQTCQGEFLCQEVPQSGMKRIGGMGRCRGDLKALRKVTASLGWLPVCGCTSQCLGLTHAYRPQLLQPIAGGQVTCLSICYSTKSCELGAVSCLVLRSRRDSAMPSCL